MTAVEPEPSTVSVTGTGRAARPPDQAALSIGISVVQATATEATERAAQLATSLIELLGDRGVASADLATSDYSLHAEYDHGRQQRRLVGYRVTNTVRVTIRDLEALPALLTAATGAGGDATTINGIEFSHADPSALVVEARAGAWADAVGAAQHLAELAGLTLGPARRIAEGGGGHPQPRPVMARAAMAEAPVPIEAGTVERTVTLAVEFELRP